MNTKYAVTIIHDGIDGKRYGGYHKFCDTRQEAEDTIEYWKGYWRPHDSIDRGIYETTQDENGTTHFLRNSIHCRMMEIREYTEEEYKRIVETETNEDSEGN